MLGIVFDACRGPRIVGGFLLPAPALDRWWISTMGLLLEWGECEKGIWWMPWRREAMKDVARCEKPGGGASTL